MNRKELIAAYRDKPRQAGVLELRHNPSGRVWFEAAPDLPALENRLRFQLDAGRHSNRELQADWTRDGEAAFRFIVANVLPNDPERRSHSADDLAVLAALVLAEHRPWERGGYHREPRNNVHRD